jgi:hypothetical protein
MERKIHRKQPLTPVPGRLGVSCYNTFPIFRTLSVFKQLQQTLFDELIRNATIYASSIKGKGKVLHA